MALIELDLTAQRDAPPSTPPPAHRYRLPGLVLAAVLLLALGGAAPPAALLWRHLGTVPAPGGPESRFQLTGGRVYTVASSDGQRVATAWALGEPLRRLWTTRFPARVIGPDEVGFGGVDATQVGDLVLLTDGPATAVADAVTGRLRWTSPVQVTPLSGGRVGIVEEQVFRPGTVYDQDSGEPGMLYFSSTGEPHVEPPIRTEVHGVDLHTGERIWSASAGGSVNVFSAAGDAPAVLILASDRLERLDGDTGAVRTVAMLPKIGEARPFSGSAADGLVLVRYGDWSFAGQEIAYDAGTLRRRWQREMPEVLLDPPSCGSVLCSGPRAALDVIDPATGRTAWRAPADVDLMRQSGYVLELDTASGNPVRLVDPVTGATRVDLSGWQGQIAGDEAQPLVLRRAEEGGATTTFGVVLGDRDLVQPLGESAAPVSDCTSDLAHVVCRGTAGLEIWAFRS